MRWLSASSAAGACADGTLGPPPFSSMNSMPPRPKARLTTTSVYENFYEAIISPCPPRLHMSGPYDKVRLRHGPAS